MKNFYVELEEATEIRRHEIYADGSPATPSYPVDGKPIKTSFVVYVYDEDGTHERTECYPITTDMRTLEDDAEEVIENIKMDFPPDLYQNNNW